MKRKAMNEMENYTNTHKSRYLDTASNVAVTMDITMEMSMRGINNACFQINFTQPI